MNKGRVKQPKLKLMSLKDYQRKRDFKKSAEPKGKKGGDAPLFVIQKHDAQNLHYDFRLSVDGVLASWAVPKGLSTAANEKRLGIRTEDHPMDYADFEGVIPQGEYGAGTVMVWDKGEYEVITDDKDEKKSLAEALEEGSFKVKLMGKKIKGGYAFARMDRKSENEQWLIFKLDDQYADARRNPESTEPDSVLTGRSLAEIKEEESN